MQAAGELCCEGVGDGAVARHPRHRSKGGRYDAHGEVGLARRAGASMAGMAGGLILDGDFGGRKALFEKRGDARSSGKRGFRACQFLVRHFFEAHTLGTMPEAFRYKPKFVDIRASKRGAEKRGPEKIAREPEGRKCDFVGCERTGAHRAPKSRERTNEYWWFCAAHAADYNRRWNYFSGMTDAELAAYQRAEEVGHRPTWTFRADKNDRLSAEMRALNRGKAGDPFGVIGGGGGQPEAVRPRRRLSRLQQLALEALGLGEDADGPQIRTRYAEEVKRWHPDSNGGDRGAEERLQKVVLAYQTLKAGGFV